MQQTTLKEAISRIVVARLDLDKWHDAEYQIRCKNLISQHSIGGFCLFGGEPETAWKCIELLQDLAPYNVLFCGDYEFGLPMRMDGGTSFPHAFALSKTGKESNTFHVSECCAREVFSIGIHWNLAPVADVNTNPENPIINIRAFGENPEEVGNHVSAWVQGHKHVGAWSCAKHFPGHGDTNVDSHIGLPVISASLEELQQREFAPFKRAIGAGVETVMLGHMLVPALDDDRPASLSKAAVDSLRNLGFSGFVVTDALDMAAIANLDLPEDPAVLALKAGVDIVLLPPDPVAAIHAIERAANEDGGLTQHIVQAAQRLTVEVKEVVKRQLATEKQFDINNHRKAALEAAKAALQWRAGSYPAELPLNKFNNIGGLAVVNEQDVGYASRFFRYMSQVYTSDCDFGFVDASLSEQDAADLAMQLTDAEAFVIATFVRPVGGRKQDHLEQVWEHLKEIVGKRVCVVVAFGSPYVNTPSEWPVLDAFSFSEGSLGSAAVLIAQNP